MFVRLLSLTDMGIGGLGIGGLGIVELMDFQLGPAQPGLLVYFLMVLSFFLLIFSRVAQFRQFRSFLINHVNQ